jgi:hypothetical protein
MHHCFLDASLLAFDLVYKFIHGFYCNMFCNALHIVWLILSGNVNVAVSIKRQSMGDGEAEHLSLPSS